MHQQNMHQQKQWEVRYLSPYNQSWRSQFFPSEQEARKMVTFYRECGSPARLVIS